MRNLWIIEARNPDGSITLSGPQPESVFGSGAITGMTDDQIAKAVYRRNPDPAFVLTGDSIATWPAFVDPRWVARRKTW